MHPLNNLRKYRKLAGLTQSALADLVGTTQQMIQRIESSASPARQNMALKLAEQLNQKVELVFPAMRVLSPQDVIKDQSKVEEVGLMHTAMQLYFRNGRTERYLLPEQNAFDFMHQLETLTEDTPNEYPFFVFDTELQRVAVNPREIVFWSTKQELGIAYEKEQEPDTETAGLLSFVFASEELSAGFMVDPDNIDDETFNEETHTHADPLHVLFESAEATEQNLLLFYDIDGDMINLRKREIAYFQCPLRLVNPELQRAHEEGLADM